MDSMTSLFSAFFIIWLFIFGYIFNLDRKQHKLEEELERVKSMLKD